MVFHHLAKRADKAKSFAARRLSAGSLLVSQSNCKLSIIAPVDSHHQRVCIMLAVVKLRRLFLGLYIPQQGILGY